MLSRVWPLSCATIHLRAVKELESLAVLYWWGGRNQALRRYKMVKKTVIFQLMEQEVVGSQLKGQLESVTQQAEEYKVLL